MIPLTADQLVRAYSMGVFPMARHRDDPRLFWIDPEERGILPLDGFHLSHSMRKVLRHTDLIVRCDSAFEEVIGLCAETAPDRPETWINEEIFRLFGELHRYGLAHSVEAWRGDTLVGGLYGLSLGGAFFGESMFSRETNASKIALAHLVARLRHGGYTLLDTQFVTEHLARFGAIEIPRRDYLRRLADAIDRRAVFHGDLPGSEVLALLSSQSSTQMS
ncbi:leucyl/phenylalanyl-tRNA--protein transferase [Telmatospirillum siberiense]|uniref:Leucyl/phenylalanyl-tRNA--protein transferase n=1 Tax=Telmatospirillum siberiense TaxID=382514 RepID=A0A2N3PWU4_9PROT|nr:leucyl/phenylalanyl-tRNA--protein transferase [Telmatospirillum siberiense]PKU24866.1 leucyl/phenylalanyl-tRNA--protein transferase [Telmatospirillum siberiense]